MSKKNIVVKEGPMTWHEDGYLVIQVLHEYTEPASLRLTLSGLCRDYRVSLPPRGTLRTRARVFLARWVLARWTWLKQVQQRRKYQMFVRRRVRTDDTPVMGVLC